MTYSLKAHHHDDNLYWIYLVQDGIVHMEWHASTRDSIYDYWYEKYDISDMDWDDYIKPGFKQYPYKDKYEITQDDELALDSDQRYDSELVNYRRLLEDQSVINLTRTVHRLPHSGGTKELTISFMEFGDENKYSEHTCDAIEAKPNFLHFSTYMSFAVYKHLFQVPENAQIGDIVEVSEPQDYSYEYEGKHYIILSNRIRDLVELSNSEYIHPSWILSASLDKNPEPVLTGLQDEWRAKWDGEFVGFEDGRPAVHCYEYGLDHWLTGDNDISCFTGYDSDAGLEYYNVWYDGVVLSFDGDPLY